MFQIDLEVHFLKSAEDSDNHESETESDKDARETKVCSSLCEHLNVC